MANNVNITPGTGDVVAAEDISSTKYQLVKLVDATAASTTRTGVAANPLQVSLANTAANSTAVKVDGSAVTQPVSASSLPLPSGASTLAEQQTQTTALQLIDDAIKADDAAFTPASDKVAVSGFIVDETGTDTLDEGDAGAARVDASRRQLVRIVGATDSQRADVDSSGHLQVDIAAASTSITVTDGGGSITVDNNGTFVVQENGAALTALQLIDNTVFVDDAAFTPAVSSVNAIGCFVDDTATDSVNEGDIGIPRMSADRVMYVQGAVAHDAADSGNPVKVGAKASATLSDDTMVANADRTDLTSDLDGAIITRGQFPLGDIITERVSNTDGASTAFSNLAATASTRNYIIAAHVFRTDAGTTPIYVDFRDGTAGSILYSMVIPPNGGAILPAGAVPYFRTSANTALAYDVSAATTTVYISVTGFKSKV